MILLLSGLVVAEEKPERPWKTVVVIYGILVVERRNLTTLQCMLGGNAELAENSKAYDQKFEV